MGGIPPIVDDARYVDQAHADFKDYVGLYLDSDGVQVFDILGA